MIYKSLILVGSAFFLGGCAIPVPLQIASWALDGISMLATQKSVTDHGISLFAQQDCAVWRGVTEGELCRDEAPTDVLVAEDAVKSPMASGLKQTTSIKARALNGNSVSSLTAGPSLSSPVLSIRQPLQVRAVPTHALRAAWADKESGGEVASVSPEMATQTHALRAVDAETPVSKPEAPISAVKVASLQVASLSKDIHPVVANVKAPAAENEPVKGIYFVIGSFREQANAKRMVGSNAKLSPRVFAARLDGSKVYRVVVGPVPQGRQKRLHRALARDGFPDTWAIHIDPANWRVANLTKPLSKTSPQLAALQN